MFFLKSLNSVTKIFVISAKGLEPVVSYVRDQDATTAPARHMWDTGSLNWPKFMLQWFIQFPEFTKFTKFLFNLRKTPLDRINTVSCLVISDWTNERTNVSCYFMLTYMDLITELHCGSLLSCPPPLPRPCCKRILQYLTCLLAQKTFSVRKNTSDCRVAN